MDDAEREQALAAVRDEMDLQGFEVLRCTISSARDITLTVDREKGGVNINDCTRLNHAVREALERVGLEADAYAVAVQSPGIDRLLTTERHFARFIGEAIKFTFKEVQRDGSQAMKGRLEGLEDGCVVIKPLTGSRVRIPLDEAKEVRLDPR